MPQRKRSISCMDAMSGNALVSKNKRVRLFTAEVLRKLRGWHARKRHVHVLFIDGKCGHDNLRGYPEYYINSRDELRLEKEDHERQPLDIRGQIS